MNEVVSAVDEEGIGPCRIDQGGGLGRDNPYGVQEQSERGKHLGLGLGRVGEQKKGAQRSLHPV